MSFPEKHFLGEYQLLELKKETECNRLWLAEQTTMHRKAVVLERRQESPQSKTDFLADIRTKASVEHPLVGSVYEAVENQGDCFAALEFIRGSHLAHRLEKQDFPDPKDLAILLKRVAEAFVSFESAGLDSAPLRLADIFLDEHGVVRLKNLVIAGEREAVRSIRDVAYLGGQLPQLVAPARPGATRFLLLLSWMRGDGLDAPLSWAQTREYCRQIEQQLSEAARVTVPLPSRRFPAWGWIGVGTVLIAIPAILAFSGVFDRPPKRNHKVQQLPPPVFFPKDNYLVANDETKPLGPFRLATHETTIGEYHEFLAALATLAKSGQEKIFDEPSQPPAKSDHLPNDWTDLWTAAKTGGTWQGKAVTKASPVMGVDWWDAMAYARWKGADLPDWEEWHAALRHHSSAPEKIPPSSWAPISTDSEDRSADGLFGMAGSLCEWTKSPAPDPANPLGAAMWVLVGGSHAKAGSTALTREWVDDRGLRRPDLGFRVIFRDLDP